MRSDNRSEDRAKAETIMAANCQGATVKVLEEGEAVVGEKTHSTAKKNNEDAENSGFSLGGMRFANANSTYPGERTNTSSETTQLKE